MTITLDLPGDLERALEAEAARLGLPVAEYAARILESSRTTDELREVRTGADLVAYWERKGVIGSRPDITDSVEHARRIRASAERRRAG
jgi:hypothetical protein